MDAKALGGLSFLSFQRPPTTMQNDIFIYGVLVEYRHGLCGVVWCHGVNFGDRCVLRDGTSLLFYLTQPHVRVCLHRLSLAGHANKS